MSWFCVGTTGAGLGAIIFALGLECDGKLRLVTGKEECIGLGKEEGLLEAFREPSPGAFS